MHIPKHAVYSKSDIKALISYFKSAEGRYSTYGMLFEVALVDALPILNLETTSSRDIAKSCAVIAKVIAGEATRDTASKSSLYSQYTLVYKTVYRNIRRVLYVLFFEEIGNLPKLLSSADPFDPTPFVAAWRFSYHKG